MRRLIKERCTLANKDELERIEVQLPGASLGVFVVGSLSCIAVSLIYFWIASTCYSTGLVGSMILGVAAGACLVTATGGLALQSGLSALALVRGKAYVSSCVVHHVHRDAQKFWVTCESVDVPGLFHVQVDCETYEALSLDKTTSCKIAWVSLMKPCLILC